MVLFLFIFSFCIKKIMQKERTEVEKKRRGEERTHRKGGGKEGRRGEKAEINSSTFLEKYLGPLKSDKMYRSRKAEICYFLRQVNLVVCLKSLKIFSLLRINSAGFLFVCFSFLLGKQGFLFLLGCPLPHSIPFISDQASLLFRFRPCFVTTSLTQNFFTSFG